VTQETVQFNDWSVLVRRSARARRIILKVDPLVGAVLVMPPMANLKDAQRMLAHHADWLDRRMTALPQRKPFVPDAVIPLGDRPHRLIHAPQARRGVWLDETGINVSGSPEHFARRVTAFLKAEAGRRLRPLAFDLSAGLGRTPAAITVREVKSRWGSCSSRGDLSFSWRLVLAPDWVMRYVVAHEVAHLVHHNHSPQFWAQVQDLDANMAQAKRWLKAHGAALFLYG
jgi:predicted metal-dependent hydrolase